MSWLRIDTVDGEIVITCLECHGAIKVKVPCDPIHWDKAVRAFRKDHKSCEPPKTPKRNSPVRVPPPATSYERILSEDD